tara:strand:+ start:85 stop:675 length:591 start_codon:yes stop_codon:yes gene_type:complete
MNEWIEQYKQYHLENTEYGNGGCLKFYLQHIIDLVQDWNAESLLDFGCGKAEGYLEYKHHEHWGIMPSLYDPAIPEYQNIPEGTFDGVISFDVMEHIPKEQIPETFDQIFSRADKFVFLGIATSPAKAVLPNGDNAHCTVEPIGWWEEMVHKHAPKKVCTHIKTAGHCNNYSILNEDLYMEYFLNNLQISEKRSEE